MRRPGRIIFDGLAGLSLLLILAAAVLWVRTARGPQIDFFVVIRPGRSYGLGTETGRLIGFLQQERPAYRDNDPDDVQWVGAGFRYLRITSDGMRRWNLVLPLWTLICALAVPPGWWGWRRLKVRRRRRAGLCLACGYDLRASPGRCPECGTAGSGKGAA